jgi:outer membrane protein insertion porin family/translocation and assembly module TamA
VADIAFNAPHLSAGLGLRYTTPVGPLRFDVGWRLPGLQVISGTRNEGTPGTTFGLPIAFNIALGEAF